MSGNLQYCVGLLQDNEESIRRDAQQILYKLCDNILRFPREAKYRKIKLSNAIVSTKLLPASGAIECLFEIGFVENVDEFLLPANASLSGVERLHSVLGDISKPVPAQPVPPKIASDSRPSIANQRSLQKEYKKRSFFEQITNFYRGVLRYEDQNLQNKAKSILPLETIQIAAMEKLREVQREVKIKRIPDDNVVYEDMLLAELLSWFKNKFFKWVNSPACKSCMGECSIDRSVVTSNPKISRVEIHKCKSCGCENEFPRYTDPEELLHWRQGRCGEWANCFTLICRAVGFDARLVYDETDHVWTEVWSPAHERWIHADACENAMDRPLLYEKGWGKKLSYVIGFSRDEVRDVTWRYSRNFREVMGRRRIVSEEALTLFIGKLNNERQNSEGYSEARRRFVSRRSALELAGMLGAPPGCSKPGDTDDDGTEYGGRTSGSLAWRLARGETNQETNHRWIIPRGVKRYELTYSVVSDSYAARNVEGNVTLEEKRKWQSGVETAKGGVFRKEESDWRMVYLARSPGLADGEVTWCFVLEDAENVCVDSVALQATTATFNGASVRWEIKGMVDADGNEIKTVSVEGDESSKNFETNDLRGAVRISASVRMSGGEGDVAWQHAQLFRESLDANSTQPSLTIRIDLTNK